MVQQRMRRKRREEWVVMDREDRQMTREEAQKILDVLMPELKLPEPRTESNFNLERMKLAVESPVSDITSEELMKQVKTNRVFYQEGYAQAELDLKREPLSEDKLDALAEANITDEGIAGYYLGFRDAEKAHGIGENVLKAQRGVVGDKRIR
jgi:hypothetical protein